MSALLEKTTKGYIPYLILFVFSFLLYANTLHHQYALDDGMTILNNEYVLKGVRGIPDIFTKDMLDSYYRKMGANGRLHGGRFRPLSLATFAVEQECIGARNNMDFGKNEWDVNKNGIGEPEEDVYKDGIYDQKDAMAKGFGLRHWVNVLLYSLLVCLIFAALVKINFRNGQALAALIIALLFAAHPIHTEVVANVKSRDEILSLLFIVATLIAAHNFYRRNDTKWLLLTGFFFLMAMLSKEFGIILLVLLPLSFYLFEKDIITSKYTKIMGIIGGTLLIYILLRLQTGALFQKEDIGVESEILNNPYLFAKGTEAFATKIFVLLKYLILLIIPYPLVSDYGYSSIPYKNTTDIAFIASALCYGMIIFSFFYFLKKRNPLAFPVAFYLGALALVSNLLGFNLGATMGERLIFHSSLGFCIVLGWLIYRGTQNTATAWVTYSALAAILLVYAYLTVSRNKDWENDNTLFLADVEKQPESLALNNNASTAYIFMSAAPQHKSHENEYILKAQGYAQKALSMNPNYVNGLLNMAACYGKQNKLDSAEVYLSKADSLYPTHPLVAELKKSMVASLHSNALKFTSNNDFVGAMPLLKKALTYDSTDVKVLYDLGVCYFNTGQSEAAIALFKKGYKIDPNDVDIQRTLPLFLENK